jgi:hypothetical protein
MVVLQPPWPLLAFLLLQVRLLVLLILLLLLGSFVTRPRQLVVEQA